MQGNTQPGQLGLGRLRFQGRLHQRGDQQVHHQLKCRLHYIEHLLIIVLKKASPCFWVFASKKGYIVVHSLDYLSSMLLLMIQLHLVAQCDTVMTSCGKAAQL